MKADELLFKYQVRLKAKNGYKYYDFYSNTKIEEFLNKNNIEYVRNMIHPFIMPLIKDNLESEVKQKLTKHLEEQLLEMSRIADKHQEEFNEIREKLKKINSAINEAKKELVAIDGNLVYGEISDRICHVIDILESKGDK